MTTELYPIKPSDEWIRILENEWENFRMKRAFFLEKLSIVDVNLRTEKPEKENTATAERLAMNSMLIESIDLVNSNVMDVEYAVKDIPI